MPCAVALALGLGAAVLAWAISALGDGAWLLGVVAAVALVTVTIHLTARARGVAALVRLRRVRRRLRAAGRHPEHVYAVHGRGRWARTTAGGLEFLVHEPRTRSLELLAWSSGGLERRWRAGLAEIAEAKVALGGTTGRWTDQSAELVLRIGDGDPMSLWVPGNQPGLLHFAWYLDAPARRRRRREARRARERREATRDQGRDSRD
ncbi:hypothetical protein AB0C38_49155 [Amycolatopsis sp. NPDC048633]|uniref:hypothetical protein n=1 Tax=Amycolatopsis sp. NPDC048633 TaxID=3157095 RepID=UPI0033DA5904